MESKIVRKNGVLMIDIDGQTYPPLSFKSFRPNKKNISDFYEAGIRLFNIFTSGITSAVGVPYTLFGESWIGEYEYDFSPIDTQIALFIENAPNAYLSLMLQLDTRVWWLETHPDYPDSFRKLAQMETDEEWREAASKYMQAVIRHVEEKYPEKFFAYFLLCGTTTEWFSDFSHEEPNLRLAEDYKKYCYDENAVIPSFDERETDKNRCLLDEEKEKNLIRFRKFESVQRSDSVSFFASKAQEVLHHKKLLGMYYGYLLELKGKRLWETGYLDYERIFLSKDIDLFSSPISYEYRGLDMGSHQMLMRSTLERHNKIYFIEHDHTTSITPDIIEGHRFVHPGKVDNLDDDINLMRRSFMLAIANRTAMWWFDMFSGWYANDRLMNEIKNQISIFNRMYAEKRENISEIAIFGDPESMYQVNKNSGLNDLLFERQRGEWSYIGAPYDLFSACDYSTVDALKYNMFIFLDAFRETEELDALLNRIERKKKETAVLFTYSAPEKWVKMRLSKLRPEKTLKISDGTVFSLSYEAPCWRVDNADEEKAEYSNGETAVGFEKCGNVLYAVSGAPTVSRKIMTELAEWCGVHRYLRSDDAIVYAGDKMIGIYHITDKDVALYLKKNAVYTDVFTGTEYKTENEMIIISRASGRCKLLVQG